jgi:hypothetical protein
MLCSREVRSSSAHLAAILSEPPSQETYSPEFVRLARHRLGDYFLLPIATFPLTEAQPSRLQAVVDANGDIYWTDESTQ